MKKIRLFSTKAAQSIEGEEAELYVNFYLVLNKNYVFTFLIDAPNLSCSDRHPIRLWKHFLIMLEEESVKYMRKYETLYFAKIKGAGHWIIMGDRYIKCSECGHITKTESPDIYNFCMVCGTKMSEEPEYEVEILTRGNCMMCGKELDEGLFFCEECETKIESEG